MAVTPKPKLDAHKVRADFPIFEQSFHGKPLAYLDSANSSQKPQQVIDAMSTFYETSYANVHRAVYELAERATAALEGAREKVRSFVNAPAVREIIFLRNATEALNLVAYAWGLSNLGPGDVVLVTELEHHSNFVPWQFMAQRTGAQFRMLPLDDNGELRLDLLDETVGEGRLKVVATGLVSNSLGTVNPIERLAEILEAMDPFLLGGHMIRRVSVDGTTWGELPHKFEAGTSPLAEAVGLGAAVDYLTEVGLEAIEAHEHELVGYALERLADVPGIELYGPPADHRAGIVSFNIEGIHPHDVGQVLGLDAVAIRGGHHCCQPLMQKLGVVATNRASFYLYTLPEEIDRLAESLHKVVKVFA